MDRTELIDILDDFAFGSHDIKETADRITELHKNALAEQLILHGVVVPKGTFYCVDEQNGALKGKCEKQCSYCRCK